MNPENRHHPPHEATQQPEKKPRVSRRLFMRIVAVFSGVGMAEYFAYKAGLNRPATAAPPAEGPPSSDSEPLPETVGEVSSPNETSLREDIQEFIDAAREDESLVITTDDGQEITRKDLLAHVTHIREVGLVMKYFMDTFMIAPKVQDAQSPHEEMEQKIAIKEDQLKNWNSSYTTNFALIVDRVIASIQEDTAVSLQEGAAYTDHPYSQDESQLRRLILYALDVTTGNQPPLSQEYQDKALQPFLKLLTDINPELLKAYLRQDSTGSDLAQPKVSESSTTPYLDVDGLIAYINTNTFEEYDLDAMMDPEKQNEFQLSRRAFIMPMGAARTVRRNNKERFREIVHHDLDNMK